MGRRIHLRDGSGIGIEQRPGANKRAAMRLRFWPKTLAVQLILVVAAAVAVSNIAVAYYYYQQSEAQARNFTNDRIVDRTVAVAATSSQVAPESRLLVMRFMSQKYV